MKKIVLLTLFFPIFVFSSPIKTISGQEIFSGKKELILTEQNTKKGTVVVFLSAKCPCSNSHTEVLTKLAQKYPDFTFLGIHSNLDEDLESSKKYFRSANLPFRIIQDEKTKIADDLKAFKTPHCFVLGQKGEILYQGGVTDSSNAPTAERIYLEEALQDISSGAEVRTKSGRTLGCAIQRESEKNVW